MGEPLARGRFLQIKGRSIWIDFKYERLPQICFSCGVIRHGSLGCLKGGARRQFGVEAKKEYGPGLRVAPPNR